MISLLPDQTLLIQWAIFITVLVVLNRGLFQPVLKILKLRQERTQGEALQAERLEAQAQHILTEYETKLQEARQRGSLERERLVREGEAAYAQILKEARARGDDRLRQVKKELAHQRIQVMEELQVLGQAMAQELLEQMLDRKVA